MRREPTAVKVSAGNRRAALDSSNAVLATIRIPTELTTRFSLHTSSKTLALLLVVRVEGRVTCATGLLYPALSIQKLIVLSAAAVQPAFITAGASAGGITSLSHDYPQTR